MKNIKKLVKIRGMYETHPGMRKLHIRSVRHNDKIEVLKEQKEEM